MSSIVCKKLVALNAIDLIKHHFPKKRNLLGRLVRTQDLALVYGPRGLGKTTFVLQLAFAMATGGEAFRWKASKPRKVVFLDGEMAGHQMQERIGRYLKKLNRRSRKRMRRNLFVITPEAQQGVLPDLETFEGQKTIDAGIPQGTKVLIVDNLSAWTRSGGETSDSWTPVLAWALKQRRMGRAVIFVHHSGKTGTQRGTSRKEDHLDLVLKLSRPKDYEQTDGADFTVEFDKARDLYGEQVEGFRARLLIDRHGTLGWALDAVQSPKRMASEMARLKQHGWTLAKIGKRFDRDKSTVSRILKQHVN